jgi:methionyl-tRNA synthetase
MYNLTEALNIGASLLESFMPDTADAILNEIHAEKRSLADMDRWGLYPSGTRVTDAPATLFERKKEDDVLKEVEKIEAAQIAQFEAQQAKEAAANASGAAKSAGASNTSGAEGTDASASPADDGMPEGLDAEGDALPDTKVSDPEKRQRSPMMTLQSLSSGSVRSFMLRRFRSPVNCFALLCSLARRHAPLCPVSRNTISRRTLSGSVS